MSIFAVIEGDTDEPVVRKLLGDAGLDVAHVYDMGGKSQIDKRLKDFNDSAKGSPWFVLRDLDRDADCAPTFLRMVKLRKARWMVFRLAVRELEAWLLADHEGLSDFMKISPSLIPARPDAEAKPTQTLVNLARRSSKKAIVRAFVPRQGDTVSVGPEYESKIIEFGQEHWSLHRASKRSPSLSSARRALGDLAGEWKRYVRGGTQGLG